MLRVVALLAVLAATVGGAAAQSAPNRPAQTPDTDLRILLWENGRGQQAAPARWTLKCEPDSGTLPKRGAACDRLDRLTRPFAPTPKDAACTEIYGGPQQAQITGSHDGRRIWVTLSARNGCEISRWNRLRFLVGGMSAGAGSPR